MTSISFHSVASLLERLGRRLAAALARLVIHCSRHAVVVVVFVSLCTALAGYYVAGHFSIDTDTTGLISRDLPFRQRDLAFRRAFPMLDNTIVAVVDGATPALAQQAAGALARWAQSHPGHFKGAFEPGGGPFFAHNGLLYLPLDQLKRVSDRLTQAQPLIAQLARNPTLPGLFGLIGRALNAGPQGNTDGLTRLLDQVTQTVDARAAGHGRPLAWEQLMTGSGADLAGERRFVIINPRLDKQALRPAQASIDALRGAIGHLPEVVHSGARVRLTGEAVLDNDQLRTVSGSTALATLLSLSLVLVMLVIGLRATRLVLATLMTLLVGLVWTAALALFTVGPFNLISVSFAVLFVGLGVDFGIQFCMRFQEARAFGSPTPVALATTGRRLSTALMLAGVAAAISFYAFLPTSYAGVVDLGLIAGTGMLIAVLCSLTVLPALIRLFGQTRVPRSVMHRDPYFRPIVRYRRAVLAGALMAALAAIPFIARTHFDFSPLSLQNQKQESVKTFRQLLKESQHSLYSIDVMRPSLASAKQLAGELQQVKSVSQVVTLASFIPQQQDQKLSIIQQLAFLIPPFSLTPGRSQGQEPSSEALKQALSKLRNELTQAQTSTSGALRAATVKLDAALSRFQKSADNASSALAALQHDLVRTLPAALKQLRAALSPTNVSLSSLPASLRGRYVAPDGRARVQVFSNLDLNRPVELSRFVHDVRRLAPHAVGAPVMLVAGGNVVLSAFVEAVIIAVVCIAALLLAVLRSPRDMLLALSPLLLAGVLTVGTMTLVGISLNLANIIVLPLLLGLGVAYGIYFVLRWRAGQDMAAVLTSSTPRAILFSALTTGCSFGSLAVASDPAVSMLGRTLSIALGWVLVCTLVVLPALLASLKHRPEHGAS